MIDVHYGNNQFVITRLRENVEEEFDDPSNTHPIEITIRGSHSLIDFKIDRQLIDLNFSQQKPHDEII